MATYKVLQDIEAEDKFVGPLTLKQFIFAGVAAVSVYLSVLSVTKHLKPLLFFTVPVIVFTGFLAWPWSRDQPTEVWAIAKLRFMFKPRRRIWNQTGIQELVTINAPKKVEKQVTNGLSSTEVKSRLKALANTIDSRGWAIKNVNVNLYAPPANLLADDDSDRLLAVSTIAPNQVPTIDIRADEDMLDPQNNPTAQHLNELMSKYGHDQRAALMDKVKHVGSSDSNDKSENAHSNQWFTQQPSNSALPTIKNHDHSSANNPSSNGAASSVSAVTAPADPAILNLAINDDLDVATIARQAHKGGSDKSESDGGEVVVPLR